MSAFTNKHQAFHCESALNDNWCWYLEFMGALWVHVSVFMSVFTN